MFLNVYPCTNISAVPNFRRSSMYHRRGIFVVHKLYQWGDRKTNGIGKPQF